MDIPPNLHFKTIHSDEQIWLIGRITILWAYVEAAMDGHIHSLSVALDIENPPGHDNLSLRRRLKSWRNLVRQSPAPEERKTKILDLADRVADLQNERHQAVHGLMGEHPEKGLQMMRALPQRLAYSKPVDTETLQATMDKIELLLLDLVFTITPKSGDSEPPPELAGLALPQKPR